MAKPTDYGYLIRERHGVLRALKSDLQNPRILNENIDQLTAQIKALEEKRAKLIYRRDHLPELIAQCQADIRKLKRKQALATPEVEAVLRLQEQLAKLEKELGTMDPELMEMLKQELAQ